VTVRPFSFNVTNASFPQNTAMVTQNEIECVLLAGRHHGLSEGIRGLLETVFGVVVMVADEASLFESAKRLRANLAVVDMSLSREDGFGLLRRLRELFPTLKVVVISAYDETSVSQSALAEGADGFVLRRSIATDLLPAVDAVRAGQRFVSPSVLPQIDFPVSSRN
jgi:DNA-binding NarL/FixJ family response regulator